ncbi:Kynureninase [Gracilaria domingensis]|nr:Kynureninase [Gracilaria domingensis]
MVVTPPFASAIHPSSPADKDTRRMAQQQQQHILHHPVIPQTFDQATAKTFDQNDPLKHFRAHFSLPEGTYLCGQSLGACPKPAVTALNAQLERWETHGVGGHFEGDHAWASIEKRPAELLMSVVGARFSHEVAVMNSLTVNLHAMLTAFYHPSQRRYKVLMEKHVFPSDLYAVRSHLSARGVNHDDCILFVEPRRGEFLIRDQDLVQLIDDHASSLALILLPGVQYYSGQVFPMQLIANRARLHSIPFGLDLAHAVGNIELSLHDWQVDFAVWCSYKYLNAGPGSIAGLFVHDRHADADLPRHAGWWGHCEQTRFRMPPTFVPQRGARGFQVSNPPVFAVVPLTASLEIFHQAGGMRVLREKSVALSAFLRLGLTTCVGEYVHIISPQESCRRGCQISLKLVGCKLGAEEVNEMLEKKGVRCDFRRPDVLRIAPVPLYNSFTDVFSFIGALKQVLASV